MLELVTQKAMFRIHNLDDYQLIKWAISLTNLNMPSLSVPFLSLRKIWRLAELSRCLLDSHLTSETINIFPPPKKICTNAMSL